MTGRSPLSGAPKRLGSNAIQFFVVTLTVVALTAIAANQASADTPSNRVDLRVLVLNDGGANTAAVATALDREGVPTTTVDLTSAGRPVINAAFLENAASHEGKFQAVVSVSYTHLRAHETDSYL